MQEAGLELDSYGVSRLALREGGWNTWNWRDYKVNYIQAGAWAETLAPFPPRIEQETWLDSDTGSRLTMYCKSVVRICVQLESIPLVFI